MYKITCDGYPLLDSRDEELVLIKPQVKVEVNTVGEGSFTIYKSHPYYDKLKKLKSDVEIADEVGVIFRGRITADTIDFNNGKAVDLEGAMAFFNDSIIKPFSFPDDFLEDNAYIASSESGNVVGFFLDWLIEQHNSQVRMENRKFKLGVVTVSDVNNYITRSNAEYSKTWDVLKTKLFDSSLGGYLCIRYEADGNYIDYLSEFTLTNTQEIEFGENLLNLQHESDANTTYSAIIPLGTEIKTEADAEGKTNTARLTIEGLADGKVTEDIMKEGDMLYSINAVENYGWIFAPVSETTWNDVNEEINLRNKGVQWLSTQGVMLADTTELTAVDLHFTDTEIRSFRIYRKINVKSLLHGIHGSYNLTKLDIDILNPQNTKITVGETKLTLTDKNEAEKSDTITKIENVVKDTEETKTEMAFIKNQQLTQQTEIINTCNSIILSALENFQETGDYSEFKSTIETQFAIMAGEISMNFTTAVEHIENVNGDLQAKFTQLYKNIDFSENGIILKDSLGLELILDTGIIYFKKNGVQFGWWDGVEFHTGNIYIDLNERAQLGDFAFVPRKNGSLSFLKVGGA